MTGKGTRSIMLMIPKEEIVKRGNQGGLRDFKVVEGGGDRRGRGGGGGRMKQIKNKKKKDKYVNPLTQSRP